MKQALIIFFLSCLTFSAYGQKSSEKLIREGVSLHDKGRYKDAITYYKQALEVNPTSMSATYEMSLSYLYLKDYDNAIKYSTKVIDAGFQPLMVDAYIVKSSALGETNKVDKSIQLLNEALVRCGDEYLLYFNLGLSYFNKKETNQAIVNLRKAIELDATRSSAFLLYAYALSDAKQWIQSFYSFHFFLLLEPNTARSKDAFDEMYSLITSEYNENSEELEPEDSINRKLLYKALRSMQPKTESDVDKFAFFTDASKMIFFTLGQMQNDIQSGLLWNFFVPTYDEILGSGHFDTYCHYISVSYFPQSLEWWNNNNEKVNDFIEWFENGQVSADEAEIGDDSDVDE